MEGSNMVMPFEKFERIMNTLIKFKDKRERISDFVEKEIATASFCVCDIGTDLETIITSLLSDEFKCWFGKHTEEADRTCEWWKYHEYGLDNDIEYWLYGSLSTDEKKVVYDKDGTEIDITDLKDFYRFLCDYPSK